MLNVLPAASVRSPRGTVKINGNAVDGWIDWAVTNNTYFEADTFHVSYAASELVGSYDAEFFSSIATDTFIEILAGFPDEFSALDSLIYGRIDDIDYDPRAGIITLTGRDLTGALIDGKVPRDFLNKTASQAAATIAQAYGLAASITATSGSIGTQTPSGHYELLHTEGSDWDLLCALARQAGFVCYIANQTLYFGPQPTAGDSYVIQWKQATDEAAAPSANATELTFQRSLTLTKGITVVVNGFDVANQKAITRQYPVASRAIKPGAASPYGPTTVYTYRLKSPSTAAAIEQFALDQFRLITAHAMKVKATLPADGLLSAHGVLEVKGTATDFDQTYFPRSITRSMNMSDGYLMSVEAQNTTPVLSQTL